MISKEFSPTFRIFLFLLFLRTAFCMECGSDEATCGNGDCVPAHNVCDGVNDCNDGRDELNCYLMKCEPPHHFKCGDGRCISYNMVCDQVTDCMDHSDEPSSCTYRAKRDCLWNEHTCANRECIPVEKVCDSHPDCSDGSDETAGCKMECNDGFKCRNGHCILQELMCNDVDDCHDNSDEEHCKDLPIDKCFEKDSLFLCKDEIACIEMKHLCDGFPHCFDKSDEDECRKDRLTPKDCQEKGCSHGCEKAPHNETVCVCPKGFRLDSNLRTCIDINECNEFGWCHQRCENSNGGFQCSCDDGYNLQEDNSTCKVSGGEALLLFASSHQIRGLYLNSQVYFSVAEDLNRVIGVSHSGHHVYWTEIEYGKESIVRSNEDGTERHVLVNSGLGIPEDLAVDYITGNIYFTDSEKKHIGVCSESGMACTVLHNEDIDKPRAIVLFPQKGVMFWSDWGSIPMIATSDMNGRNQRPVVVENIKWPNGLALDQSNDRLYWVDAKGLTIESARLDGSDRQVVLKNVQSHPYSITIFEDTLYWSNWENTEIQKCNKFTGRDHKPVIKEKKNDMIYGVHIYHSALQPKRQNPCENSYCSDICLLGPKNSYTCACAEHSALAADKHTCRRERKQMEAIVGVENKLFVVKPQFLGKSNIQEKRLKYVQSIECMAYDSLSEQLLISDSHLRIIVQYDFIFDDEVTLIDSGLGTVISMSFDSYGNNLYLCDAEKKTVEVWSMTGLQHVSLVKLKNGDVPINIVVIPEHGILFFATLKVDGQIVITRMNMDGTQKMFLFSGDSIIGPQISLSYDRQSEKVYWCDSGADLIESMNIDGSKRKELEPLAHGDPVSIASQNKTVMWVKERSPNLYILDITGTESQPEYLERIISLDEEPFDGTVSVVASQGKESHNLHPCQNSKGGCSHLCLVSNNNHGICHCPPDMYLQPDNKTCSLHAHCKDDQFKCRKDDKCIPKIDRCDGHQDCPSGEDEENCQTDDCDENDFKCTNGQCIPKNLHCDYNYDCSDKSDETFCVSHCEDHDFQCGSGECIEGLRVCNYENDCKDGSDELNCRDNVCPPRTFQCLSGTCIPDKWFCDGDIDCTDGSDEAPECKKESCSFTQYKCDNTRCIDISLVCDDQNDCGDNSDERFCDSDFRKISCNDDEMLCSSQNPKCVPQMARCNGTAECSRGEDETDCTNCQPSEFQCKNQKCIHGSWICDKRNDCGDNSDEDSALCQYKKGEMRTLLPCNEFKCDSGECLPVYLACNGEINCKDGSDEGPNCGNVCSQNACQQNCHSTPKGAICSCEEGYRLNSDGHTCSDIDECVEERCSQNCRNTPGGFNCSCARGYLMKSDGRTCKAIGGPANFIVGGEDEIRNITDHFSQVNRVLFDLGEQILGLDVDSQRGSTYWSAGISNTINVINTGRKSSIKVSGRPGELSYDWRTGNIFYVETSHTQSIRVCHFEEKKCANVLTAESNIIVKNLNIDHFTGVIYYSQTIYSAFQHPVSEICQYSFADENSTVIVSSNVAYVSGIAVDTIRRYIYWSDLHTQIIERVRFDGTQRQIVLKSEAHRPESLTFFEDSLYWLTRGAGEMKRCWLYGDQKGKCDTFSLYTFDVKYLKVSHEAIQPNMSNPCLNVCDSYSLCVLSHNSPKCICEDGTVLAENEECDTSNRITGNPSFARSLNEKYYMSTQKPQLSGSSSAVIAVLLTVLAVCTIFASYLYVKKRKTSPVLLETMHFQNLTYDMSHVESSYHHNKLTPGEHQYENPAVKLVQHPDGSLSVLTTKNEAADQPVERINIEDYDSEESDQYETMDAKANLIR